MRRPSSTFSVKRWTLKITLCLIAGAVVTWAVAWGLMARACHTKLLYGGAQQALFTLQGRPVAVGFGVFPLGCCRLRLVMPQNERLAAMLPAQFGYLPVIEIPLGASGPQAIGYDIRDTFSCGWPLTALWSSNRAGAKEPDAIVWKDTVLPRRMFHLGFALDTLLYGGVVLGVVEGVGFARRRRRIAKGRCPSCGYDRRGLAGDATCPECGRGA